MLADLQADFYRALFNQNTMPDVLRHIRKREALSNAEQFAIYRDSVYAGLCKALATTYPVCQRLVGEVFFNAMVSRFISDHPSKHPDLNHYGRELAEFIAAFPPVSTLPYLADVARLEWAWHTAFNAETVASNSFNWLKDMPAGQYQELVFLLPASSSLLRSNYPVHRIWEVNQVDYSGDTSVDLDTGGICLLIWRYGPNMHIDPLSEHEWVFLSRLAQGHNFGKICDELAQLLDDAEFSRLLANCISRGWIVGATGCAGKQLPRTAQG